MLHTIEHSRDAKLALVRVGAYQLLLLKHLCAPATRAGHVNELWVRGVWFKLPPVWVVKFCGFRPPGRKKPTALACMRKIAAAAPAQKRRILDAFVSGLNVSQWFTGAGTTQTAKSATTSNALKNAVVNLLHTFYAPALYADRAYLGYLPPIGDALAPLSRDRLEELFDLHNDLDVCPYCNGSVTHRDMDHYVPLSRHPWLSCSPLNLVPACKGCNLLKTTKPPWTSGAVVPTADWFHPYLRPAERAFTIQIHGTAGRPEPRMQPVPPTPVNRCSNFENLVCLPKTWRTQARSVVNAIKKELKLEARRRNSALGEAVVRALLTQKRDVAITVVRSVPYSLVRQAICEAALANRPGYMQMFIAAAVP